MSVRDFIADCLNIDPAVVDAAFNRESCAQWDSFAHLNLMLALEREFGVPLNDATIAQYQSLSEIEKLFNEADDDDDALRRA